MKVLLDTNVLVAACVQTHKFHSDGKKWLTTIEHELSISAHSIFETYATLTGTPFEPKIEPRYAEFLIFDNILKRVELLFLDESDYKTVVSKMAENEFKSGLIDAAIIHCAVRNGVKKIVTGNVKHFQHVMDAFGYDCEIINLKADE